MKMTNRKRKITILFDKVIATPIYFMLLLFYRPRKEVIRNNSIHRILLIRPGGIGDFLLNVPAFKELRKKFPKAEITIFLFNRNKDCIELYNDFNNIIIIDNLKEFFFFLLKNKNYDLCIDFDQHRKIPSIISILSKAKVKIGFNNSLKGKAYNYPVQYNPDEYEAQSFLNLLKPININKELKEQDLILNSSKRKIKNSIGVYACAMKEENRLDLEKWKEIIRSKGKDKHFFFFGGKNDIGRYNLLENKLKGFKIHRRDGKISLLTSLKEISRMERFISEDGGVYHLAVCTGVPTLSYWLHGEKNMKKWKAPFRKHKGILLR